ncbi:MAG: cyclase family protein [Clostridia bacterium]|nr:cyclase family protein [Clostridia bacterium]
MQIYDISQEVFSSCVFPGDPAPQKDTLLSLTKGDVCNLTAFSMCAHNGTHVDAPVHFIDGGNDVQGIALEKTVGYAFVASFEGTLDARSAHEILARAASVHPEAAKRILLKGNATVSSAAAAVFAAEGVYLIGNESQTVGPPPAPKEVHLILLEREVVLLEGVRLAAVPDGVYFLCAAPLALEGADGAPTRALLIDFEN